MAMRQKLSDNQLDAVAGGVTYDNSEGDHSVYKIGKNDGPFTHTFLKKDKDKVKAIIAATFDTSLTGEKNDENIMAALIASGYLTEI